MSMLFSCSVMSNSLWPHRLQQARIPCPSLFLGVCTNSCPLSQWCHPSNSSSLTPFASSPQSFPASGSFPMSHLFASGDQSIAASALESVLSMNIQFPLWLIGLSPLLFMGLSQGSSPTPQFKSINSSVLSLLSGPALTSIHHYRKSHSFD